VAANGLIGINSRVYREVCPLRQNLPEEVQRRLTAGIEALAQNLPFYSSQNVFEEVEYAKENAKPRYGSLPSLRCYGSWLSRRPYEPESDRGC
jgi:hypothetical protein